MLSRSAAATAARTEVTVSPGYPAKRWLDLFLEAKKTANDWGGAFQSAMQMDAWLEKSWFMIVPLALNALVLCPIVIRRAMRGRGKESTGTSIAIAAAVGILTLIYLVMVFAHQSAV